MTADPICVAADARIADVLISHFGSDQRHRAFPVTRDGILVGMVDSAGLTSAHLNARVTCVGDLYGLNAPVVALATETCRSVATRLAVHELERVPVVADAKSHRLIGLVSRSDLIKATLSVHDEEHARQTFRRFSFRSGPASAAETGDTK